MTGFLLPDEPVASLDDYMAAGGGGGLRRAAEIGPDAVIAEIRQSGLRGRGGGGFPTGIKWRGLRDDLADRKFVVANGAEGEPGTFKDRLLMRRNPYQLVEGIAIAADAVGAEEVFIGLKSKFGPELEAVKRAVTEMSAAGLLGELAVGIVEGPDDYLFGEEKALLEVIEGRDPLPRLYPPYVHGLFASEAMGAGAGTVGAGSSNNPAVVNNVETLSNVPHIVSNGADWFREMGTDDSPGTMVFTVSGDVRREVVVELEIGTPLSFLIFGPAGGVGAGRRVKAAVSGVSNRPVPGRLLDTPLSFDAMKEIGAGLGSGGFIVYDDTACMPCAAETLSSFLAVGSCGQCPPCKLGTQAITDRFGRVCAGEADPADLEEAVAWVERVTDANRCGLGAGQRAIADGFLGEFWDEFAAHLEEPCPPGSRRPLAVLEDFDAEAGEFRLGTG